MDLIGKKRAAHPCAPPWSSLYDQEIHFKEHPQYRSAQAARNARFLAEHLSWWNPKLRRQECHEKLLQQSEWSLWSHQSRLISASVCRWNQAHIREELDPREVGWIFRWCFKQAIFSQRQGDWTTAASPSEWVIRCHSNHGVTSDSYQSTIQS